MLEREGWRWDTWGRGVERRREECDNGVYLAYVVESLERETTATRGGGVAGVQDDGHVSSAFTAFVFFFRTSLCPLSLCSATSD